MFLNARKDFCSAKTKAKRLYFAKEKSTLSSLSKTNSRKFWKYINKFKGSSKSNSTDIGVDDFVNHFKNMSNTPHPSNFNADELNNDTADDVNIEELDCQFTSEEICKTILRLKRHKSCDISNNVADLDSMDYIAPYLT